MKGKSELRLPRLIPCLLMPPLCAGLYLAVSRTGLFFRSGIRADFNGVQVHFIRFRNLRRTVTGLEDEQGSGQGHAAEEMMQPLHRRRFLQILCFAG